MFLIFLGTESHKSLGLQPSYIMGSTETCACKIWEATKPPILPLKSVSIYCVNQGFPKSPSCLAFRHSNKLISCSLLAWLFEKEIN